MKRIVLMCCLSGGLLVASAQQPLTQDALVREIAAVYEAAANPGQLRQNADFKAKMKEVIRRGDASSVEVINRYATFVYMNGMRADVEHCIDSMSVALKESEAGQKVLDGFYRMRKLEVGMRVPDFTMNTPEGKPVNLYEFIKGKKCVILDFWASWCGPCRKEGVNVKAIYNDFHAKGFDVLGVSCDEKREAWEKGIAEEGYVWEQVCDFKGFKSPVCGLYSINGIPALFLIDENGKLVAKNLRGNDLREKVAEYCK